MTVYRNTGVTPVDLPGGTQVWPGDDADVYAEWEPAFRQAVDAGQMTAVGQAPAPTPDPQPSWMVPEAAEPVVDEPSAPAAAQVEATAEPVAVPEPVIEPAPKPEPAPEPAPAPTPEAEPAATPEVEVAATKPTEPVELEPDPHDDDTLIKLTLSELHEHLAAHPEDRDRLLGIEQAREHPRKGALIALGG